MTDLKKKILDRREFIKLSAAAGTGILLSPYIKTSGQESSVTNDINIALLGTGAQGQVLLSAILKIPNIKFKAVCDIWTDYNQLRAHRLLQKYGHELNAYVDYK